MNAYVYLEVMADRTTTLSPARATLEPHVHRGLDQILAAQGFSPDAVAGLLEFDAQMFRWRTMQNKGEFMAVLLSSMEVDLELGPLLGLLAVSRLTIGLEAKPAAPPTIGDVADEMKIDPSRASRIVAELVEKGYLRREADQSDGRRSVLVLTDAGAAVMGAFRQAKWRALAALFNDWSDADIQTFSSLMARYLDGMTKLTSK